jgi:hypothetical protein
MPGWFWIVVAVSVVGELVAVWLVLQRVRSLQGGLADLDPGAVRELATSVDPCVTEHMASSYGGDVAMLPEALRTLLPRVRELVRGSGLPIDERALRLLVANTLVVHGIARRAEIERALDGIPAPERADAA